MRVPQRPFVPVPHLLSADAEVVEDALVGNSSFSVGRQLSPSGLEPFLFIELEPRLAIAKRGAEGVGSVDKLEDIGRRLLRRDFVFLPGLLLKGALEGVEGGLRTLPLSRPPLQIGIIADAGEAKLTG